MKVSMVADVAAVLLSLGFFTFTVVRVIPVSGDSRSLSANKQEAAAMTKKADAALSEKLAALDQAFEKGLFTQQEYEAKRASLLNGL